MTSERSSCRYSDTETSARHFRRMLNSAFQLNVGLTRREAEFRYWPVACDVLRRDESNTTPSHVGPELLAPSHSRPTEQWDTEALHSAHSRARHSGWLHGQSTKQQ